MAKILLIDDNQAVLNYLRIVFMQNEKYTVQTLQDSTRAYDLLLQEKFDILLLDMDMPEVSGLDILQYIKARAIDITTIVLTGVEDIDLAIAAMKSGTYEYLLKPVDTEKLLGVVETILEKQTALHSLQAVPLPELASKYENDEIFKSIITRDEKMYRVFNLVEKFARTDNSVLIWGESGSGKELIAQAIHKISGRRDKPFVAVNAGAFAQELFASEFFGYEKGAFTGAHKDKAGFIEEAQGGTLFLDEIGELSFHIQVKLLRVLQEEEFYRLGSTKNIKADVRIIAATNKDLFDEIKKGSFRKDLFFRLNINSISLPPLRERKGDIELLASFFLEKFNAKYHRTISRISEQVLNALRHYSYPGNVRELMNIINSSVIIETGQELRKNSLPNYFLETMAHVQEIDNEFVPASLASMEKEHIRKTLIYTGGNRTKAAQILGISRVNLLAKIKTYAIDI